MAKADPVPWKNKIVGFGEEDPEQLLAHDENWRIHPAAQQQAMTGVLRELGLIQTVIVNTVTQKVIDGHMRIQIAITEHQPTVPVTYVELTEDEERLALATFDPLGALAVPDPASLTQVLGGIAATDPRVTAFLDDLYSKTNEDLAKKNKAASRTKKPQTCPSCGHIFTPA